jgi:flavin-dependent dehydrogenase
MQSVSRQSCDVAIIGAGPAGAVAAALLRQKSLRVLVLEKQHFPRFSIGESLLPQCMDILQRAGMLEAVTGAGFQIKKGAAFSLDGAYESFDFGIKSASGWSHTYQVQRARFDQILADEAGRQGAEIRYGQTITGFDRQHGKPCLEVEDESENRYRVDASFVLDASGFGRVLARLLELDRPSSFPRRSSIFTHVGDNIDAPEFERDKILISIHPRHRDIWYWLIPFSDGRASVGVVAPDEFLELMPGDDLERLRALIGEVEFKARLLRAAEFDRPAGRLSGYASAVNSLHGENFALLGNAGEFLDPIFSSGLTIALKSSSLASELVWRELQGEDIDWEREFSEPLMCGVDTFRNFVGAWYDGRLQQIFFSPRKGDDIKRMICSILAGYAWDRDNPYARNPARLDTLYRLCAGS